MRLHLRNIHLFRRDDGELYNLTLSGGVKIGELKMKPQDIKLSDLTDEEFDQVQGYTDCLQDIWEEVINRKKKMLPAHKEEEEDDDLIF
jgi:hypothetical protein